MWWNPGLQALVMFDPQLIHQALVLANTQFVTQVIYQNLYKIVI